MSDIFTVSSSVLPATAKVAGFRGSEGISRLYVFEILLLMTNDEANDFNMADAINAKITLTLHRSHAGPPLIFHGILSALELVHALDNRSVFRATLVPQLWRLTQTLHSRLFTNKSVPDMIKDLLEESGLTADDYTFWLHQSYKPEEHVCQYRESHFDFISRWMEREGIYYFFEQGDDREKLIITDTKSSHSPLSHRAVRYFPQTGADVTSGDSFRTFTCRHTSLPSNVRLKDYDYAKPSLDVSGTAPVSPTGLGEISVYGARFFTPGDGERLAKLRAQELLARRVVFHATGAAFCLRPGYTFEVEEHPQATYNASYLAVTVEHYGNQAFGAPEVEALLGTDHHDVYRAEVVSIPASVQFRAESKTAWPRIYSFENAVIDGPAASEYAQLDEHGRYSLKFKFDEGTLADGKASTMVRMMQPHGGSIEGFHFPLRKGTEVVVSFLGGDPDRPIIAGVVPNILTPSPVTSGNHTKNVIQTGGRNRIELDDLAGQQRITLSTPYSNTYIRMGSPNDGHELIVKTDDNTLLDAGTTLTIKSGSWREDYVNADHFNTTVNGTVTDTFNGTHTTTIQGKITETYNGGHETTVNGGYATEHYNAGHWTEVKSSETLKVKGGRHIEVTGAHSMTTHGAVTDIIDETKNETVTGAHTITTGARTETVNGNYTQNITGTWTQTTGNVHEFWTGAKSSHTYGFSNSINIGGKASLDMSLNAQSSLSAAIALTAGLKLEAKASASITMSAACDINARSVVFNTESLNIDTKGCGIKNLGLCLQYAGLAIFT